MKRVFTLLTTLSLVSLMIGTSYAEESTESTTSPSTSDSSGESPSAPDQTATIIFTYIDVDTNQEIAVSKSLTAKVGTTVPLEVKTIPGYSVSDVMLVNEIDVLSTDYTFPIGYVKDQEESETPSSSQPLVESSPSSSTLVTEKTSPSAPLKSQRSTLEGDVENDTKLPTTTSEELAPSSSSAAKTVLVTSSSSSTNPLSSQKEKKLVKNQATKTTGFLPKAGNASQNVLILIGLGTILTSLIAYWGLKKKLT